MDNKRRNKTDKLHFRDRQVNNKMQKKNTREKGMQNIWKSRYNLAFQKKQEKKTRKMIRKKERENLELITLLIFSIFILVVIESISRKSFVETFKFIVDKPVNFIMNYFLIVLIFSVTIFIKRKRFGYFIISLILLLLAAISAVLVTVRGMPISPYDIQSYKEAISIASIYISFRFEILLIILLLSLILISTYIFIKDKKSIWFTGTRNPIFVLALLSIYLVLIPQLKSARIVQKISWNVELSYKTNGFVYSFIEETKSSIRHKPDGYSQENIIAIRNQLDKKYKKDSNKVANGVKPNIIMVQLEAFMDPTKLSGVNFNEDPMPNMRRLMKNYTSGYMNVPVTGGGTARTEYEVLSGSNFDYLSKGEIPYHTFLSDKASLGIPYYMELRGYKTVAIHNFYKSFYNRDKGLKNIGFEKFIPLEVMTYVDYTPMGWPKDEVLTRYITQEIDSDNQKPSFIFTVSAQGHSRYPMGKLNIKYPIEVVKSDLPKPDQNQIQYYANQVKEMDKFVGKLVEEINKIKQPTVLVFYGDHLPALNVITENRMKIDKFSSLVLLINNFGVEKTTLPKDFQSYQLSTLALDIAGQGCSPMTMVHKYLKNDKEYQKKLELVQYDILFGKKYYLKESEIPKPVDMKIGNGDMKLINVENVNGEFYITGKNLNRQTAVFVDGKKVDSDYKNDEKIKLYDSFYSGKKEISLKLLDKNGEVIQESEKIKYEF